MSLYKFLDVRHDLQDEEFDAAVDEALASKLEDLDRHKIFRDCDPDDLKPRGIPYILPISYNTSVKDSETYTPCRLVAKQEILLGSAHTVLRKTRGIYDLQMGDYLRNRCDEDDVCRGQEFRAAFVNSCGSISLWMPPPH